MEIFDKLTSKNGLGVTATVMVRGADDEGDVSEVYHAMKNAFEEVTED